MNANEQPAAVTHLLNDAQHETLALVLNLIIAPSDDGKMPGAAEYDVWGYLCAAAPSLAPLVRDELQRLDAQAHALHDKPFAGLDASSAQALLEGLRGADPGFMSALARQTVTCFYQQDRVLAAIGMEARPPFPLGYQVEAGDLSLLDPVRARGRIYREVTDPPTGVRGADD